MMVEDELDLGKDTKRQRDWPENVRRVACLENIEPAFSPSFQGQPRSRDKGVQVLDYKRSHPRTRGVRLVLVQVHAFDDLLRGVPGALRADDRDVVPGRA